MIAGNEDDVRALAGLAHKLLHDIVVRLQPARIALQAPEIDDVADEIDGARLVIAKEIEKSLSLSSSCAKMNVRHEKRAKPARALGPGSVFILNARKRHG